LPVLHVKAHVLPEQPAWAPLGVAPQQLVPQRVLLQLMSQPLALHTAEPLEAGPVHLLPQPKQFKGSADTFVHVEPHSVWLPQSLTQAPLWQSWPLVHEVVHEPQYCLDVCRSTAPVQLPQALFVQVCVPVLQLPQLRVLPFWHATHRPVLARHSGVAPEQAV